MAPAPKKPCNRCKITLTVGPYCPECAKLVKPIEYRESASKRGYDNRWHKIRNLKLMSDPLCERCLKDNFTEAAVLVHHKDRNPKNNDPENHESLCLQCHQTEHKDDNKRNYGWT